MPKDEIAAKIHDVVRRYGYDGATLSRISKATGLSRATLYHYFPGGKDQMVEFVLSRVLNDLDCHTCVDMSALSGSPRKELPDRVEETEHWLAEGPCILAALTIGDTGGTIKRLVRDGFERWVAHLASLLMATGVPEDIAQERSLEAVANLQGFLMLSYALNKPDLFRKRVEDLRRCLLEGCKTPG